ncbi:hypothetical protein PDE_08299 [Penicillium oxalicum 114-2]|uniref:Uncharacterized protein n=1 Tax=Penicillium oxalicum (strain 114-2 / CGMCC 5302) TaxID=933388 RepID=S8BE93_PENO1|nr:hypothetical protein PDE_08299 [Penicillium oxalicum 114-2]
MKSPATQKPTRAHRPTPLTKRSNSPFHTYKWEGLRIPCTCHWLHSYHHVALKVSMIAFQALEGRSRQLQSLLEGSS